MFRISFGLLLLVGLLSGVVFAQKTTEEKKRAEAKVFSFSFGGESFLGIYPEEVNNGNFTKYGLREVRGVAVSKVEENGPAAKAGIIANDVIVKFDGEEVTSVRKLNRLIGEVAPDHKAKLTVLRGGQEMEFTAVLGRRKFELFDGSFDLPKVAMPEIEMPDAPSVLTIPPGGGWTTRGDGTAMFFGSSRRIGVSVSSLTKQLGEYFGVPDGKGLLVTNVSEGGPAFKAGIRAGDVIVEADGKTVDSNIELIRAIGSKKDGDVRLTVVRDKNRQSISVTPETAKEVIAPFVEGKLPLVPMPRTPVAPVVAPKPMLDN